MFGHFYYIQKVNIIFELHTHAVQSGENYRFPSIPLWHIEKCREVKQQIIKKKVVCTIKDTYSYSNK